MYFNRNISENEGSYLSCEKNVEFYFGTHFNILIPAQMYIFDWYCLSKQCSKIQLMVNNQLFCQNHAQGSKGQNIFFSVVLIQYSGTTLLEQNPSDLNMIISCFMWFLLTKGYHQNGRKLSHFFHNLNPCWSDRVLKIMLYELDFLVYRVSHIEMSVFKWFWGVEESIILIIFL
jgi:hypothetical protein